jgi:hypothetical protein
MLAAQRNLSKVLRTECHQQPPIETENQWPLAVQRLFNNNFSMIKKEITILPLTIKESAKQKHRTSDAVSSSVELGSNVCCPAAFGGEAGVAGVAVTEGDGGDDEFAGHSDTSGADSSLASASAFGLSTLQSSTHIQVITA